MNQERAETTTKVRFNEIGINLERNRLTELNIMEKTGFRFSFYSSFIFFIEIVPTKMLFLLFWLFTPETISEMKTFLIAPAK